MTGSNFQLKYYTAREIMNHTLVLIYELTRVSCVAFFAKR